MEIESTALEGVVIVKPRVFEDSRGFFLETFSLERYSEAGIIGPFVQDNWSHSQQGTLRGLHYQIEQTQGKLVQVLRGAIFDVAVDLRRQSPTFGQWIGVELSSDNKYQLYIPPGFAHGFYVQSKSADFLYKCTDYYAPEYERTLLWNDVSVGVQWPVNGEPILSEKDRIGTPLPNADLFA